MGTGSLILPIYFSRAAAEIRPRTGRYGRAALAVAATAAVASTAKDRRVSGPASVAAITTAGLQVAASWAGATSARKLFAKRVLPDLGNGPLALGVAVLWWDFAYYWNHRFMHEWRYMWAVHVVHHSSEHYNLSTALRQTWTDVAGTFVPYGLVSLLGVRPEVVEQARGINLIYQFWFHTDVVDRLGPAELVLNTPSHHRVHHGANPRYIDKNYGSILILWDRLFGTFEPEDPAEPVVYGLTKNIDTFNPLRIAFGEYVSMARDVMAAEGWKDRLSLVLRGPGWADRWRRARSSHA